MKKAIWKWIGAIVFALVGTYYLGLFVRDKLNRTKG